MNDIPTRLPWMAEPDRYTVGDWIIRSVAPEYGGHMQFIARFDGTETMDEPEAALNAKLTVQAVNERPGLLEAVKGLLEIIEGESGSGANFWEDDPRYQHARRVLGDLHPPPPDATN